MLSRLTHSVGRMLQPCARRLLQTGTSIDPLTAPATVAPQIAQELSIGPAVSDPIDTALASRNMPKVLVLGTGGTIASRSGSALDMTNYGHADVGVEDLLSAVPELKNVADLQVEQVENIDSSYMTPEIWAKLSKRINKAFADDDGLDGIVVTHGTDTMEETAYYLNLTVDSDRPVVMVGSQRPSTGISSDGPINLISAVRAASDKASRNKGVLVVLNDEINAARSVYKTDTLRMQTFRSRDVGVLGMVDSDRVVYHSAPVRRHTAGSEFTGANNKAFPRIGVALEVAGGDTGVVIDAYLQSGVEGLVLAGLGNGHLAQSTEQALVRAKNAGVPIMMSSRCGAGRVTDNPNYTPQGVLGADDLRPQKARILLGLALQKGLNRPADLRRVFDEY